MADVNRILDRWVAGDSKAGDELYRLYVERVRRFALAVTRRELDADEIAHEALAEGLEGLKTGPRPDKFTAWIFGVVKNMARRRSRGGRPGTLPASDLLEGGRRPGPKTRLLTKEMDELLDRTMEELPADQREVVRLRFRKGLKREEIAEREGVTIEAIDKRVDRAFERMRQALSRHFTTLVLPSPPGDASRLRPSFREVYTLCRIEGLSEAEAARRLKLPLETVANRLRFALETLGERPASPPPAPGL